MFVICWIPASAARIYQMVAPPPQWLSVLLVLTADRLQACLIAVVYGATTRLTSPSSMASIFDNVTAVEYFVAYMKKRLNGEMVQFWFEAQYFRAQARKNLKDNKHMAGIIFAKYIAEKSERELNISSSERQSIQKLIASDTIDESMFVPIQKTLMDQMSTENYDEFWKSSYGDDLLEALQLVEVSGTTTLIGALWRKVVQKCSKKSIASSMCDMEIKPNVYKVVLGDKFEVELQNK